MTDHDGWNEYRALFLDDREQNRANFEKVVTKLDEISSTLVVMRTERRISGWVVGIIVPALVALVATGVSHAFGY